MSLPNPDGLPTMIASSLVVLLLFHRYLLPADIEIQANEILHHKLTLNGYLAEFTGKSMEQMTMDTDRDFFMGAEEAVEYGIIDAVVSKPNLALASTNGSIPR